MAEKAYLISFLISFNPFQQDGLDTKTQVMEKTQYQVTDGCRNTYSKKKIKKKQNTMRLVISTTLVTHLSLGIQFNLRYVIVYCSWLTGNRETFCFLI